MQSYDWKQLSKRRASPNLGKLCAKNLSSPLWPFAVMYHLFDSRKSDRAFEKNDGRVRKIRKNPCLFSSQKKTATNQFSFI